MAKTQYDVDLCVIGAGSGGLSLAWVAANLDLNVVLFEADKMGGDCLNHGCVPSKAIIAAGKHAQAFRTGAKFGIKVAEPEIDFEMVKSHIAGVIKTIEPVDSVERYESFGTQVITERARFKDANTVESDTTEVRAKRFVIATGSRAAAPPIPGLDTVDYLTNETIFSVNKLPKHLLVIGSGPIGLELGQAFRRFGSDVTIFDMATPLGRSEPEHAEILVKSLESEGVTFRAPSSIKEIKSTKTSVTIVLEGGEEVKGSHLLVAAGRRPVMDGLNLDAAGIEHGRGGIKTDDYLKTTNKKVWAIGDVSGKGGLTHAANFHAGQISKNFYFTPPGMNVKGTTDRMPAVIYAEPELASIGMTEAQAREAGTFDRAVHWEMEENDRSIAELTTDGAVKIICGKKGKILGASIVGPHAGEMIHMVSVAMANKVKISGLSQIISPYPTRSEAVKRAASSYYTEMLFGEGSKFKKLARLWTRFH